jgi:hypothetical protein
MDCSWHHSDLEGPIPNATNPLATTQIAGLVSWHIGESDGSSLVWFMIAVSGSSLEWKHQIGETVARLGKNAHRGPCPPFSILMLRASRPDQSGLLIEITRDLVPTVLRGKGVFDACVVWLSRLGDCITVTFERICKHRFIAITIEDVPIIPSTRANPSSSSSSDDRNLVDTRLDMRNSNAGNTLTP